MLVKRRSVCDPVIFSRAEAIGDERLPELLNTIDVDKTGAGTLLDKNMRPSIMHQTDIHGNYSGANKDKYKPLEEVTPPLKTTCCSRRDSVVPAPEIPPKKENSDTPCAELRDSFVKPFTDKICLVLDLDETLVHSAFNKPVLCITPILGCI